jgi:hypothetical protein
VLDQRGHLVVTDAVGFLIRGVTPFVSTMNLIFLTF